ncbi:hypothetical protein KR067_012230, partial [Drosophila pandora]
KRKVYHRSMKNLVNFTLRAIVYGSWILGVFPFTINSGNNQIIYLKSLQIYGLLLNFGLLAVIVSTYQDENSGMEIFDKNELVQKVEYSLDLLAVLTIIVIHLLTLWKSRNFLKILNELWSIKQRHFKNIPREKCYFDRCVLFKGVCIVLQIMSALLLNFGVPQEGSYIWSNLNIWFYVAILTGAILTMAHFHITLLYIYQFIWSINQQILECFVYLERGQRPDPEEILVSLRLFSRLLHVKDKLSSIYEVEITLEIAIVFFYNIGVAYSLIIFSLNAGRYNIWWLFIIIPLYILVNIWNLWLSIIICDYFESECRKSSKILRLFSGFTDLDKDLERIVEEFSLFCSHCPIRIRLFGLFDVNYKMGFGIINTNFLYILFLAQFDYRNMRLK